jgi:CPA2 family monovalent cation:H+ antiporter-2
MFAIGFFLGQIFGWNYMDSFFLGAILCISSTTIIVKVFMDLKMIKEDFAQVVFGILILEDIVAILILSVLSGLGSNGGTDPSILIRSVLRISFFIVLFLLFGLLLVPRFIHWIARFRSKEIMGIVVLGLCLLGSLLALHVGFSIALGAFLMGSVIAASREIDQIEEWIHPVRDMFSAIFFVSAGMLIQPNLLLQYGWSILIVTIATLIGKILSGAIGSFLAGYKLTTSVKVGVSLAQIGEFSFVIASLGVASKITSDFLYPLAVAVSSLTTICTPYLIRSSDTLVKGFLKIIPKSLESFLERYHSRVKNFYEPTHKTAESVVLPKYLLRLIVYVILWFSILLATQAIANIIGPESFENRLHATLTLSTLWTVSAILTVPLFLLLAKYINHIILLLVTRNPSSFVIKYFDIHVFYNTMQAIIMSLLAAIFMSWAWSSLFQKLVFIGSACLVISIVIIFKRKISTICEYIEKLLDEILGLATSEPTRQAALHAGNKDALFHEITRQFTLRENSPAAHKSIRALGVREKTGASIIAIYRHGKHIANPNPDAELLPNDVLILLGEERECEKARELLE